MKTTTVHYVAPKECPWTWRGKNLAEMRRSELRPLARAMGVAGDDARTIRVGLMRALEARGFDPGPIEVALQSLPGRSGGATLLGGSVSVED